MVARLAGADKFGTGGLEWGVEGQNGEGGEGGWISPGRDVGLAVAAATQPSS